MKTDDITRLELDVEPWLLHDNDAAPEPGRVLVIGSCDVCRTGHRWGLPLGVWTIDHDHGGHWSARLQRTTAADPTPAGVSA